MSETERITSIAELLEKKRHQAEDIETGRIILITELLEQKHRKEEELEYYRNEVSRLRLKADIVEKELEMTRLIIELIENEKIRTK